MGRARDVVGSVAVGVFSSAWRRVKMEEIGAVTEGISSKFLWDEVSAHTHTRARAFNGPLTGTTQVSRYQKGKTNLDFTEARDSEWQWHQLGNMQVCTPTSNLRTSL